MGIAGNNDDEFIGKKATQALLDELNKNKPQRQAPVVDEDAPARDEQPQREEQQPAPQPQAEQAAPAVDDAQAAKDAANKKKVVDALEERRDNKLALAETYKKSNMDGQKHTDEAGRYDKTIEKVKDMNPEQINELLNKKAGNKTVGQMLDKGEKIGAAEEINRQVNPEKPAMVRQQAKPEPKQEPKQEPKKEHTLLDNVAKNMEGHAKFDENWAKMNPARHEEKSKSAAQWRNASEKLAELDKNPDSPGAKQTQAILDKKVGDRTIGDMLNSTKNDTTSRRAAMEMVAHQLNDKLDDKQKDKLLAGDMKKFQDAEKSDHHLEAKREQLAHKNHGHGQQHQAQHGHAQQQAHHGHGQQQHAHHRVNVQQQFQQDVNVAAHKIMDNMKHGKPQEAAAALREFNDSHKHQLSPKTKQANELAARHMEKMSPDEAKVAYQANKPGFGGSEVEKANQLIRHEANAEIKDMRAEKQNAQAQAMERAKEQVDKDRTAKTGLKEADTVVQAGHNQATHKDSGVNINDGQQQQGAQRV